MAHALSQLMTTIDSLFRPSLQGEAGPSGRPVEHHIMVLQQSNSADLQRPWRTIQAYAFAIETRRFSVLRRFAARRADAEPDAGGHRAAKDPLHNRLARSHQGHFGR
jgi:hypothetical protein